MPMPPALGQLGLSIEPPPAEAAMIAAQEERGWSHCRPNSTLIAAIGNHWAPGAWQYAMDMVK